MTKLQLSSIASILLASVTSGVAQTPLGTEFTYQGRLNDGGGPASGTYDLRFVLYDTMAGGTPQGSPVCADDVSVTDGLFTVELDFGAPFDGQQRFLQIEVRADTGLNCGNLTGFVTLIPRQALTGTPYSHFASNADQLDGLDSTAFLQAVPTPLWLWGSNPGAHIIRGENSSTGAGSRGVYGLSTAASGTTYGGWFENDSTEGRGVFGYASAASGYTYGVSGTSHSTEGRGVSGWASATTGVNYGVFGRSESTDGRGVFGEATAATGATYGVHGRSDSGTSGCGVFGDATAAGGTTYGGLFRSSSTSGTGVRGLASATLGDNYGGRFQSDSTGGTGAFALAGAAIGPTYGLRAQSNSTSGTGVYGLATAEIGETYGGYFQADSTGGYGVFARGGDYGGRFESGSTTGRGVYGYVSATSGSTYAVYGRSESSSGRTVYGYAAATGASDTPYGVRGYCSTATSGYAVYAAGDMGASGAKPFRIDHPDDPENKYLLHYATESPEVVNFYRGMVALDERGEAVVNLPPYFAKIDTSPSYQLTAVGAPMPGLHIAEKISPEALDAGAHAGPRDAAPVCTFRIAGGVPGGEVSWRVEAVRNDLRMRLHGAPVEREKSDSERGKYQHPEYYGQPPEMGMDCDAPQERSAPPAAPEHR